MMTSDDKLDRIFGLLEEIRASLGAPPRVWLSPAEAASYLGVSVTRIYQLARGANIPFHRLPDSNLLRFHVGELDAWVRSDADRSRELSQELIRRLTK